MIIDCHSHCTRPLADKVIRMTAAGVDHALLSVATGNPETALNAADYARERKASRDHIDFQGDTRLVLAAFDEMLGALAEHPGRFTPLAPALFGIGRGTAERWAARAVAVGCAGFGEAMPAAGGMATLDASAAAADDAGGMLFLLNSYPPTTVADMEVVGTLASRYRRNRYIIGHLGAAHTLVSCEVANRHCNVFLDTSTQPNLQALRVAFHEAPAKLLFGSNDPYGDPELSLLVLRKVSDDKPLLAQVEGERLRSILAGLDVRMGLGHET